MAFAGGARRRDCDFLGKGWEVRAAGGRGCDISSRNGVELQEKNLTSQIQKMAGAYCCLAKIENIKRHSL